MDIRLDKPFESWGGFGTSPSTSEMIHGRLRYAPEEGIHIDFGQDPRDRRGKGERPEANIGTLYGKLVNGLGVTLEGCYIKKSVQQWGFGFGSPSTVYANKGLFGRQVADIDGMNISGYAVELSSLANWACTRPVECDSVEEHDAFAGYDVKYRRLNPIRVNLKNKPFDIEIREASSAGQHDSTFSIEIKTFFVILARETVTFEIAHQAAWQLEHLLSLLIGDPLGVKSVQVWTDDTGDEVLGNRECNILYNQRAPHAQAPKYTPEMLLPYSEVKDSFGSIVERWFSRSEQALLATNIYFGSLLSESPTLDVRFLSALQAAESYHRSLGTGFYMDRECYENAIQSLLTHLPSEIAGDHRHSLKNRLKYGNEFSLRKRLSEMFHRLPTELRTQIAVDVERFITRVVDTRNYYTHYDHPSKAKALEGKNAYAASERVRALIVANLLLDLGVPEKDLTTALLRSRKFTYWMSEKIQL